MILNQRTLTIPASTVQKIAEAFLAGQSVTWIAERAGMRRETVEQVIRGRMRELAVKLRELTAQTVATPESVIHSHVEADT